MSGVKLARLIAEHELDEVQVGTASAARSRAMDADLNCFISVYPQPIKGEGDSALRGVPVALKDNISVRGKPLTCASKILSGYTAPYDATVTVRLKQAGLQIIGSTNMDEFAFGSSTENSCYGPTANPWDTGRVPGGSSGGSAAAVAARLVPCALGSDTGGSIRQPAALCGVVGMKPTYGRVSRYGLVAFGSSLDQIGPFTTNFEDCAHLLNVLCGADPRDSTCASVAVPDFTAVLNSGVKGLTIGIPREYYADGLDSQVRAALEEVQEVFAAQGARCVPVSLPHTRYAVAAYYIIASSEASSNLQRFDGIRYGRRVPRDSLGEVYGYSRGSGFGAESKRRIFLGTYCLSSGYYDAYYIRALKVRTLIRRDFEQAFTQADVLLTPTTPAPAFLRGEKTGDPLQMYLSDVFTSSANLAGVPAVSFPCGYTREGLPVGAQLIGRAFDEETLIRAGNAYQQHTAFHARIPEKYGPESV
ncbi:MAG: Asp-tRNA(Asn)/Glu-tRNA(Gln) amidotransferase subunit GatA [Candidatus Omnitrophica bacterium]|nr:Asp-tRNA(Asn)/Glu-tRNA(Gln) amidotransferase subunit GatA [Candidatus Omnitrophota bacterium]